MNIGIEVHTGLVYEGPNNMGYAIWPSPVLLQAVIYSSDTENLIPAKPNELSPFTFLFREDSYDTLSRVRRGRLYRAGNTQPVPWRVNAHPALAEEQRLTNIRGGISQKSLYTFSSIRLRPHLESEKIDRPIFVLGSDLGFTVWSLVNVETSASREELISLRARQSIGALPRLIEGKISKASAKRVIDFIQKLEADIYSAGSESVIDRAREAATAITSAYLQEHNSIQPGGDLGKLATQLQKASYEVAGNAASIVARLHARGKHAEQERRILRPIHEQDAQLAIQCVGTILCDIGWAEW